MRVVIPALPSGYDRPYPELVINSEVGTLRRVAVSLAAYRGSKPLCYHIEDTVCGDTHGITSAIGSAILPNFTIMGYLRAPYHQRSTEGEVREKWAHHIARAIYEQLGECQT